jgi:hypothetical protein
MRHFSGAKIATLNWGFSNEIQGEPDFQKTERIYMATKRELDIFTSHYSLLREYLGSFLTQSQGRSSAKDKLSRLPPEQFFDVSTDLYDEINRRIQDSKEGKLLLRSLNM